MQIAQLLKKVKLFNGLSDSQIERVAKICQEQSFNAGDVILKEQTRSDDMYIIREGLVEIIVGVEQATSRMPDVSGEMTIVNLGKGQVFGEMALVDRGLRAATVRCVADNTTLYAIKREDLMCLCEEDTRLGFIVMMNIAAALSLKLRVRNLAWVR